MVSLVYASSAVHALAEHELLALLQTSRRNNIRLDITGMLLYKNSSFMQALEGPEQAVTDLYKVIEADPRHKNAIRLLHRNIEERQFPEWSMGFRNLDDPGIHQLPGYSEFLNEGLFRADLPPNSPKALRLLEVFRSAVLR